MPITTTTTTTIPSSSSFDDLDDDDDEGDDIDDDDHHRLMERVDMLLRSNHNTIIDSTTNDNDDDPRRDNHNETMTTTTTHDTARRSNKTEDINSHHRRRRRHRRRSVAVEQPSYRWWWRTLWDVNYYGSGRIPLVIGFVLLFLLLLIIIIVVETIMLLRQRSVVVDVMATAADRNNNNNNFTCPDVGMTASTIIMKRRMEQQYMISNVTSGIVASDQSVCSQNAVTMIFQKYTGSTAIDAAIFTALCLGLVNPASSGLGGGAFLLLHHTPNINHYYNDDNDDDDDNDSDTNEDEGTAKRPQYYDARTIKPTRPSSSSTSSNTKEPHPKVNEVIDCRERAPQHANSTMYQHLPNNASVYGTLAIPIMGELHCLWLAHYRFGSGAVSWTNIVQPVIDMANHGIVVGSYLAKQIHDTTQHHYQLQQQQHDHKKSTSTSTSRTNEYDSLRALITHENNWSQPLVEGDVLINRELGATLSQIAQYGIDALYSQNIATAISNELRQFRSTSTADGTTATTTTNSIITPEDYVNYRPTIHTPIMSSSSSSIHGFTIMGVPPPSSGGAAIIGALRFLSNFSIPLATYPDTLSIHRIVEACKHVFSMRMSLSDPDYNTQIVNDVVQDMIGFTSTKSTTATTTNYMELLRQQYYSDTTTVLRLSQYGGTKWSLLNDTELTIRPENMTDAKEGDRTSTRTRTRRTQQQQQKHRQQRHQSDHHRNTQRTFGYLNDHGTSHFSVVDQYGNAVAMTTSINTNFGSHIRSPSTGIIFSNTMDDFSKPDVPNHYGLKPSVSNYIQPGKRPLSSMSPTMVFRDVYNCNKTDDDDDDNNNNHSMGDLVLVIGASGGPKIITAVLQVLIRTIFMGQDLFDAILHPRIHNQLIYHNGAITAVEQATIVSKTSSSSSSSSSNDGRTDDHDHHDNRNIIEWDINVSQRTRDALIRRHHDLIPIDFSGTVQAIGLDYEANGPQQQQPILIGVSDPRKDGSPAGY